MSVFRPRAVRPKSTWRRSAGWMVFGFDGSKSEEEEEVVVEEMFHAFLSMIDTSGWNQVV